MNYWLFVKEKVDALKQKFLDLFYNDKVEPILDLILLTLLLLSAIIVNNLMYTSMVIIILNIFIVIKQLRVIIKLLEGRSSKDDAKS